MGQHESADLGGALPGDLCVGVWARVAVRQVGLGLLHWALGGRGPRSMPRWTLSPTWPFPPPAEVSGLGRAPHSPFSFQTACRGPCRWSFGEPSPPAAPGSSLPRPHHHSSTPLSGLRSLRGASAVPGPWTPQLPLCGMGQCTHAVHRALSQGLGTPRWGVRISSVCEWPEGSPPAPPAPAPAMLSLSVPASVVSFPPCRSALCSGGA